MNPEPLTDALVWSLGFLAAGLVMLLIVVIVTNWRR